MKKNKRTYLIETLCWVLGFAFLIGVWYLCSYLMYRVGNRLLPYPHEVLVTLAKVLFDPNYAATTYSAIGWTLARLLIGFTISFLLGMILGTIGGLFKNFKRFMSPFVSFAKTMPTAAFVIILLGVFLQFRGLSPYIPCFLVFMVAFPLIYEAFASGIENEAPDVKDALKLDGGDKSLSAITQVLWPDSESYINLSIAQSLGLSMKVSVMSEILTNSSTSQGGIGWLIADSNLYASMKEIMAYSLIAVFMVAIIDIPLSVLKKEMKKKLQ
ncbi:MAG: hypothetical protein LKF75_01040 [Bacilli bacterium]|jgi:NitT/TauT family transport system permease protein|nr:hypothetical protein [Bacilli bacterium]MCH4210495.1 hypothetical protein [Bacilli bacterium]MCH4228281.1 hypothetical protein [Bacilli bacterium]MCH4277715.1 hypothetical protein [Bacilli bacterium]MCI2054702.1 hypothetical protein [Bacilli bacterium]